MTYLELINAVLRRLRENEVETINENNYSSLLSDFVNDAKREVEDAWQWRDLVDSITVTCTPNTDTTYDLEDYTTTLNNTVRKRARFLQDTDSRDTLIIRTGPTEGDVGRIRVVDQNTWLTERSVWSFSPTYGAPDTCIVSTNPTAASGKTKLRVSFYPIPDKAYTIKFWLVNPQNDLANATDDLVIPESPVIMKTYLYALYERGEEIGEALNKAREKDVNAIADAIMQDSIGHMPTLAFSE